MLAFGLKLDHLHMQDKFSYKLLAFLSGFSGFHAYIVIIGVLFVCGLGVPIPEDITLVAAGILAALGKISFGGAIAAGMFGVLVGDSLLFFMGKYHGSKILTLPFFRKVFSEERIAVAKNRILANSKFICFLARFLPGLRSPIFLTAGMMGVSPVTFLALDGFAAIISVPLWVYVGFLFGNNLDNALETALKLQKWILLGIVLLVVAYVGMKKFMKKKEQEWLIEKPQEKSQEEPPTASS